MSGTKKDMLLVILASAVLGFTASYIYHKWPTARKKPVAAAVHPKVTEASITLGEQFTKQLQPEIKWYGREIYVTAPTPYSFWDLTLSGFIPNGLNRELEAQDLSGIFRGHILMFVNEDPRPIPIRLMHDGKTVDDGVIVASEYIDSYTEFKDSSKPTKITVGIAFVCRPEYGKTEYHIALTEFDIFKGLLWPKDPTLQTEKDPLPIKGIPTKDFIVARCGE